MPHIFVTRSIPDAGLQLLAALPNVKLDVYERDEQIPATELRKRVAGVDILVPLLTDHIDGAVMDAAGPQLKMIANYAVGFDNIDLAAAKARNITVTNAACPEISESVAEHAIALILGLAHRIVETDAFTRRGEYHGWGPKMFLGTDIADKTLGIIGGGAIGSTLARRLHHGFDMKVLYTDIKKNEELEYAADAVFVSKEELLQASDVVSLHVPLLPSTRHLISTPELKLMRKTAFLINTARGPVVDELALTVALEMNLIAGAALDVYECEPHIDCKPEDTHELRKLSNVILTPHTASATIEARQAMSKAVGENIIAFLEGKTPKNIVKN